MGYNIKNINDMKPIPPENFYLPITTPLIPGNLPLNQYSLYHELIQTILPLILPKPFFKSSPTDLQNKQKELLQELVPIFTWSEPLSPPFIMSFMALSKMRPNVFKFFYEMVTRWLIPGKHLYAQAYFSIDFTFPELNKNVYTLMDLKIHVKNHEELSTILKNLPGIESEIRLGIPSTYQGNRILESKGLSSDEKTALIQEFVSSLIHKRPQHFDIDIYSEMQHFMVICRREFKTAREYQHMSRIICIHYIFRKILIQKMKSQPDKRHILIKVSKTRLHKPNETLMVLGIIISLNFLRDNESLEEKHILKAIQNYVPQVEIIEGSFFTMEKQTDDLCTIYLEIKKEHNCSFNRDEIQLLKKELSDDLKDRIEHLMHPIFMPHNEEEKMRNILTLSHELQHSKDLPQVIISFQEQTDSSLIFCAIILRVLHANLPSIEQICLQIPTDIHCTVESVKEVGLIRKKYPKEANILHLSVEKSSFLRNDHSIDLYKARQKIAESLKMAIGEFRDFNGGMISKQNELFCTVRELLSSHPHFNEFILENFFYSLTPPIMRTVCEPLALKELFALLLETVQTEIFEANLYFLNYKIEKAYVLIVITAYEDSFRGFLHGSLKKLQLASTELASSFVHISEKACLSCILRSENSLKQKLFLDTIVSCMEEWQKRRRLSTRKINYDFK